MFGENELLNSANLVLFSTKLINPIQRHPHIE